MSIEEQVIKGLENVFIPGITRDVIKMNLLRNVTVIDHKTIVTLSSTGLNKGSQDWIEEKIKEVTKKIAGINETEIAFKEAKSKELNKVKHIIAVMSGKGGVGKSLVTGLTAIALRRKGFEVGILDADITGPSIPKMFGVKRQPAGNESGLLPVLSRLDISIMSINLLLQDEEQAVIWRGPLIAGAITQFWEEVLWGNLDYLIVDLPPGTADVPLTVMQSLPLSGIIIVFTPQDLTAMVVKKAINMTKQLDKPILGVIENMSYMDVAGTRVEPFGKSKADDIVRMAGAPLLGQIPIDPALAKLCDDGLIELYDSDLIHSLGEYLVKRLPDKASPVIVP